MASWDLAKRDKNRIKTRKEKQPKELLTVLLQFIQRHLQLNICVSVNFQKNPTLKPLPRSRLYIM
jgi:hypothetical protein